MSRETYYIRLSVFYVRFKSNLGSTTLYCFCYYYLYCSYYYEY